mmetsp:Transcript_17276/g.43069  ORF Transcript_17276/g.43069 Transcript_17276/m.43069 type:complete len:200 (-) Transcript_17276:1574-2173(-)
MENPRNFVPGSERRKQVAGNNGVDPLGFRPSLCRRASKEKLPLFLQALGLLYYRRVGRVVHRVHFGRAQTVRNGRRRNHGFRSGHPDPRSYSPSHLVSQPGRAHAQGRQGIPPRSRAISRQDKGECKGSRGRGGRGRRGHGVEMRTGLLFLQYLASRLWFSCVDKAEKCVSSIAVEAHWKSRLRLLPFPSCPITLCSFL